jgi:cold shock CspA family protein
MSTERTSGAVKSIQRERGFLFVRAADGDVFIHFSAFAERGDWEQTVEGDFVSFTLSTDRDGRKCGKQAELLGAKAPSEPAPKGYTSIKQELET